MSCSVGVSSSRGKNAGAVKSSTKTNGKMHCISDSEPVRSAIAAAMPPMPAAVSAREAERAEDRQRAARVARAEDQRDEQEERRTG